MKSLPDARPPEKILVVDDDVQIRAQIRWALGSDYTVLTAADRPGALEAFRRERIPVVLLDLGLPPRPREAGEGLQALEQMVAENPLVKVIIVSGNAERENAMRAVMLGAHDIFPKPVDLDELKIVLGRVFKRLALERDSLEERKLAQRLSLEEVVGSSRAMQAVYATVRKVAATEVPVLIAGESGTGKELIAGAIHRLGPRCKGPFVPINCGAIPETLIESELFGHEKGSFTGATVQRRGRIEYARDGTLFLDEIAELAPELQVKLLRFLQEKVIERIGGREPIRVDARIIAASNQDLQQAVAAGRFREDLFFRLAVIRIDLPPLRARGNDVVELAEHLVRVYSRELKRPAPRFSRAALEALRRHDWPGNVRELQNRIQRALVLSDQPALGPEELELEAPPEAAPDERAAAASAVTLKEAQAALEREMVERALRENAGNISKAARALGVSRPTLYSLMDRHGLR